MTTPQPTQSSLEADRALALACVRVPPDRAAQRTLLARFDDALIRFFRYRAAPNDFEDLRQRVWVLVLGSRPERLAAISTSLRAYVYGIARHVLYAHYRERSRSFDPLSSSIELFDQTLSRQVAELRGAELLRASLQLLPVDQQLLLEMRYFDELTTSELAEVHDVPLGTIKSRLAAARRKLDEHMAPKGRPLAADGAAGR
jgi:RNA polymerase sigma factor (sigma-70 family)